MELNPSRANGLEPTWLFDFTPRALGFAAFFLGWLRYAGQRVWTPHQGAAGVMARRRTRQMAPTCFLQVTAVTAFAPLPAGTGATLRAL